MLFVSGRLLRRRGLPRARDVRCLLGAALVVPGADHLSVSGARVETLSSRR
jgi:hypothetical protein